MRTLKAVQVIACLLGMITLFYALGIFFEISAIKQLWIWPESPSLGLAFVGSWFAAVAVALIWIGLSGHLRAIRPGALGSIVAFSGSATLLWSGYGLPGKERFLPFAILFILFSLLAIIGLILNYQHPSTYDRKVSPVIRWTFLIFSAIFLLFGLGMVLNTQGMFPAPLSVDLIRLYGWFFLGSFVYFFFGYLNPTWLNSTSQLLSLLVFDLLLIPIFLRYWSVVPVEFRLTLIVYLTFLITSALVCTYFLFIDRSTRLFNSHHTFT